MAQLMPKQDKRTRHIPVIDDKGMVGMVSIGDVVRAVMSEYREQLDRLNAYIQGYSEPRRVCKYGLYDRLLLEDTCVPIHYFCDVMPYAEKSSWGLKKLEFEIDGKQNIVSVGFGVLVYAGDASNLNVLCDGFCGLVNVPVSVDGYAATTPVDVCFLLFSLSGWINSLLDNRVLDVGLA
ncbi:hypothetical protein POTOM_054404 [Populus tomentosa]|uniref:CBS domain-containing protein n=1 Tax=Populus tomentosa TaxID=118781 RepID=A0A8X8C4S0_POPTO|nr:hypothetical protein POTOM_054404 [Populus tomentosa]